MSQNEKLLLALLSGKSDSSFPFSDLRKALEILGGICRIRGDHFIYSFAGIQRAINIQPLPGGKSKPYQVRQVREFIIEYGLGGAFLA